MKSLHKIYVATLLTLCSMYGTYAQDNSLISGATNDSVSSNDVVEMGWVSQRRGEITGAVSVIQGNILERSPTPNLSLSLQGRIPGLIVTQNSGQPTREGVSMYGRGRQSIRSAAPTVVIDGIPSNYLPEQIYNYISPEEIASITYIKDAATAALYGLQGNNGILVFTTKKGHVGDLRVNINVDQSVSELITHRGHINSWEYAELRNTAFFNDGRGEYYAFTQEQIDQFKAGDNELYPNNNWFDQYYKPFALRSRANVDISGGSERLKYYGNLNVMNQGGQFKTEKADDYDPNPNFTWFNIRNNIDVKINDYLSGHLRLAGNIKREHQSAGDDWSTLYWRLFSFQPTEYGPVTPELRDEEDNIIHPGGEVVVAPEYDGTPFYGLLNRRGYTDHTVVNIWTNFGLNADLGFITPGLKLSGLFAYRTNSVGNLTNSRNYERWNRTDQFDELLFEKYGTDENTPLSRTKSSSFYYHLDYGATFSYEREFGPHKIGGNLHSFFQTLERAGGSGANVFPYKMSLSGLQLRYGFGSRYLLQFDAGYSGSDQFAPGNRFFFNPAVSGAWIISNETFFTQPAWLTEAKLRGSYGKTLTDNLGASRFSYLDNLTFTAGPIGRYIRGISENLIGNPDIEPEMTIKRNFGVDVTLFNALSITFDAFKERVENMYVGGVALVPAFQGVPLSNYPFVNSGEFENRGYELGLNFAKNLSPQLAVRAGGWLAHSRNRSIHQQEAGRGDDYAYPKRAEGFPVGQDFALQIDYSNGNGLINTQEELDNLPEYAFGTPGLGDVILLDLNEDGIIDEKDQAPVGYGAIPQYTYAFHFGATYRQFEINVLFQGVDKFGGITGGFGTDPQYWGGLFSDFHHHAWTPERYASGAPITSPAIHSGPSVNFLQRNNYFYMDRSYLRLKNIEVVYQLPNQWSSKIGAEGIRLALTGHNLWTNHRLKTEELDPEIGYGGMDQLPGYKTYNLGIKVTF